MQFIFSLTQSLISIIIVIEYKFIQFTFYFFPLNFLFMGIPLLDKLLPVIVQWLKIYFMCTLILIEVGIKEIKHFSSWILLTLMKCSLTLGMSIFGIRLIFIRLIINFLLFQSNWFEYLVQFQSCVKPLINFLKHFISFLFIM